MQIEWVRFRGVGYGCLLAAIAIGCKGAEIRREQKRHERRRKEGKEDAEGVRFCLATSNYTL